MRCEVCRLVGFILRNPVRIRTQLIEVPSTLLTEGDDFFPARNVVLTKEFTLCLSVR